MRHIFNSVSLHNVHILALVSEKVYGCRCVELLFICELAKEATFLFLALYFFLCGAMMRLASEKA